MKKLSLFILILLIGILNNYAQTNSPEKYRRSSLSLILIDSDSSTDTLVEINTLKESELMLLEELKRNQVQNIEQIRQEIDEILWGNKTNINTSSVRKIARDSWGAYPFPDKYDKNEIKTKNISITNVAITLSNKDRREIAQIEKEILRLSSQISALERGRTKAIQGIAKKTKTGRKYAQCLNNIENKYGKNLAMLRCQVEEQKDKIENIKVGGTRSTIFTAVTDQKKDTKNIQPKIEKQLEEQRIAHQLVRKWFSSEDGKLFDMSTIQKRGLYDASMLDVNLAKSTVRGMGILEDAGAELIDNTFVVITDIDFFSNKPIADMLRMVSKAAGNAGIFGSIAGLAMNIAAAAIEDGYSVFSKTFLYKLKWDEKKTAEFYAIWGDEKAFEKMDFQLEFVGVQYERSVVNAGIFSKKENRKMETVIKKLTTRNLDENFANLQKKYDVFKPKVPIKTSNPLTAEIGMKEGLDGGERFEILEMTQNPETGRTKWVRVGTATVDKKLIWDNRYNAGEEPENKVIGPDGNPISATTFKNNNTNAQVGMFLRQIK